MKSIEITKPGYDGIPADADALTKEDVQAWAETRDPALIPYAIALIKAAKSW